ncbi:hypothetical protein U4P91_19605 [Klebsiella variicola subsp. variicola]|uniref:hypothetical protein n=1 Tax=Klebsiella variicola TaxID=244366 RepID=UPI002FE0C068
MKKLFAMIMIVLSLAGCEKHEPSVSSTNSFNCVGVQYMKDGSEHEILQRTDAMAFDKQTDDLLIFTDKMITKQLEIQRWSTDEDRSYKSTMKYLRVDGSVKDSVTIKCYIWK